MGQIIGVAAKPKRCNLNKLSQLGTPAAGEYILVSSDNSMNAAGQGNFDCYIEGDGSKAATELPLQYIEKDAREIKEAIVDYFIICRKENFSGWGYGGYSTGTTDYPLTAGVTYELIWDNSATIYFRWWDENNTQNTPLNNRAVTGPFIYEFTPEVNVVKWNVSSSVTNTFTIRVKNLNRNVLLKDDIVNDLTSGGEDVPLSAEQGKVLNDRSVAVLNSYSIPLSRGAIYGNNGNIATKNIYTHAKAAFVNSGFSTLRIKNGYQYKLYTSDKAVHGANNTLSLIVSSFTSEPYINTSTAKYFWIDVQKTDGSKFNTDEFFDVVSLEYADSLYNFKTINDVSEYFKFGTQYAIDFNTVDGYGWDDNGDTISSSSYYRTDYIDVSELDAIKMHVATTNESNSNGDDSRVVAKWFDTEYNAVGVSKCNGLRSENTIIIGVPKHASYVSIYHTAYNIGKEKLFALKHEKSVADACYYNSGRMPIGGMSKVSLIIVYGQSLSTGSDATAITLKQNYSALKMLNGYTPASLGSLAFVPMAAANTTTSEMPAYGLGEMFVEAIQKENGISVFANEWERHYIVLASCGAGQTNITQLKDGTFYNNIETAITNTKNLCDEFGFTMDVPAWVWMQGEQDMKAQPNNGVAAISTPDEYKTALLALHEKICASITTITGSTKRPKCAIYQPASQCLYTQTYNFANSYLAFNNAYVDLLKDNDEFLAVAPVYIFDGSDPDHVPSGGNKYGGFIHLDARSYKTLGAYAGYSIKKALIDGVKVKGVIPIDITVDGTTISIKYNVPCPPLKFDTEWVKEPPLTNGVHNYGFNVVKSDDTELITNVSVFDDTVTIECSESPIGAKLRYGLNGDRIHMQNSEYWGIDGRIHGGRGNLRDSQGDYVQKEIRELGQTMRLDNWAYCFEELLTEPTGE